MPCKFSGRVFHGIILTHLTLKLLLQILSDSFIFYAPDAGLAHLHGV
jgi:hypothetical protein